MLRPLFLETGTGVFFCLFLRFLSVAMNKNTVYNEKKNVKGNVMKKNKKIIILVVIECILAVAILTMLGLSIKKILKNNKDALQLKEQLIQEKEQEEEELPDIEATPTPTPMVTPIPPTPTPTPEIPFNAYEELTLSWDSGWQYADYSKIHTSDVKLYRSLHEGRPIICVNAGHGTSGGGSVKTQCHPDGSPKVTGGSTSAGATMATAVASGTTMVDGTAEAVVTLKLALIVRDQLLDAGFSVLMIRDSEDVQLDNIARTVFANNNADCHIAIHYDSTTNDKGAYYMSVPDVASYKNMEPVASHWQEHNALGESLITGLRSNDVKIFSSGSMGMDLTQTSYSTVPSIDIEVGDRGSDYSEATLTKIAAGLVDGVKDYFGELS